MMGTIKDPDLKYIKRKLASDFNVYAGRIARFAGDEYVAVSGENIYLFIYGLGHEILATHQMYQIDLEEIEEVSGTP